MPSYTPAQAEAIASTDEPLQIIACAGSGKTQVISERIVNILRQPDVKPCNIVAFTFTEKAAAELKERVLRLVEEQLGDVVGLAEMYIGTMHGYCLNLLQTHEPDTFKFQVLSDIQTRLFVDRNSKKSGLTECPVTGAAQSHLKRYQNSRLYVQAMSVLREDEVDLSLVPHGVLASQHKYTELLYGNAMFDYAEIIALAVDMLESADDGPLRRHVRDEIRFVVVDEYQDVNPLQERLVKGLTQFGANLCVVGDDDQTIYQWRGSEVENILTFADRYEDVKQVTLAANFRSSKGIVELGRTIAEQIPPSDRLAKAMVAGGHQQWERGDLLALELEDEDTEAEWIADRIQQMQGVPFVDEPGRDPRGLSWSDCAVLFRSVAKDAGPLVAALKARGIKYVIKGLNRLFESPEILAQVGLFDYVVGRIGADNLRAMWESAELLPAGADWAAALRVLDIGRDFQPGQRWGIYNIQRLYLDVLEALEIREDTLPGDPDRRQLAFYQLGKFSQVISDFEQIYFASEPQNKYETFANWLQHQAPDYYEDVDSDVGYATPNAVVIATVHQAKGMQWPVVFVPCLRRNRFPSRRWGGLSLGHVIPPAAVRDFDRYRGSPDDERRLFYVAVTRAQKFLNMTYSPGAGQFGPKSEFFVLATKSQWVSTRESAIASDRLTPQPLHETPQVTLSFSELKYLFECPYQFKLRFLYGFNAPIHEALGYGKGLHDALAEMHKRALDGEQLDASMAEELVGRHLHVPFAYPTLRDALTKSAIEAIRRYFRDHGESLAQTEHSEKQIQVHVAPGITVDGRIDLVRRLDTDEIAIVDFKSTDRAQAEEVTRDQLHVYAVGYEELTGSSADLIEVLNLDAEGKSVREEVERSLLVSTKDRIRDAGESLRRNDLPRLDSWCSTCAACDMAAICRQRAE